MVDVGSDGGAASCDLTDKRATISASRLNNRPSRSINSTDRARAVSWISLESSSSRTLLASSLASCENRGRPGYGDGDFSDCFKRLRYHYLSINGSKSITNTSHRYRRPHTPNDNIRRRKQNIIDLLLIFGITVKEEKKPGVGDGWWTLRG